MAQYFKAMTNYEILQEKAKSEARRVAKEIEDGSIVAVLVDGNPTNFYAARLRGKMWVVGRSMEDILFPDAIINGRPARVVK